VVPAKLPRIPQEKSDFRRRISKKCTPVRPIRIANILCSPTAASRRHQAMFARCFGGRGARVVGDINPNFGCFSLRGFNSIQAAPAPALLDTSSSTTAAAQGASSDRPAGNHAREMSPFDHRQLRHSTHRRHYRDFSELRGSLFVLRNARPIAVSAIAILGPMRGGGGS